MTRISKVTGKPVRKYTRKSATKKEAPKTRTTSAERAKLAFISHIADARDLTPAKKIKLITEALNF